MYHAELGRNYLAWRVLNCPEDGQPDRWIEHELMTHFWCVIPFSEIVGAEDTGLNELATG